MQLRLISNAKEVAFGASSMWALYGVFIIDGVVKVMELIQTHRDWTWRDFVAPVGLILAMTCRLIQQKALETATEKKLAEETQVRMRLESAVKSDAAPLTGEEVKNIKDDVKADIVSPQPVLKE